MDDQMARSTEQLKAVAEGYRFLGDIARGTTEGRSINETLGFRAPVNRRERRSVGQTNAHKAVALVDVIDWKSGPNKDQATEELRPSTRAVKRRSGASKKAR